MAVHQAADHHRGQRALHVAADAARERRREEAERRHGGGHQHRPEPLLRRRAPRPRAGPARVSRRCVEVGHHDDAVLHRDAEERDEADRAGDVERHPAQVQRDHPAEHRQRHVDRG